MGVYVLFIWSGITLLNKYIRFLCYDNMEFIFIHYKKLNSWLHASWSMYNAPDAMGVLHHATTVALNGLHTTTDCPVKLNTTDTLNVLGATDEWTACNNWCCVCSGQKWNFDVDLTDGPSWIAMKNTHYNSDILKRDYLI